MITDWLKYLTTSDRTWRRYAFDHVTIKGRPNGEGDSIPIISILRPCFSEYDSGPSLCHLAEVAGQLIGPGFYGLDQCRALGFDWQPGQPAPVPRFQLTTPGSIYPQIWDATEARMIQLRFSIMHNKQNEARKAVALATTGAEAIEIARRFARTALVKPA